MAIRSHEARELRSRSSVLVAVACLALIAVLGLLALTHQSPRLLVDPDPPGGLHPLTISQSGVLTIGRNGCVMVGDAALVAPGGSFIGVDGSTLHLAGIGTHRLGETLPPMAGMYFKRTQADMTADLQACGPGSFNVLWGR